MKISCNWLNEYINTGLSPEETGRLLTGCGLEVEGIEKYETVKGGLAGIVVGEVLTCVKHPGADKLSLTTVNAGTGEPLNIVCGAPNVATGQKVAVAMIGSTLYPSGGEPFTIKKSKIRGELSEGMLCAEDELGLGTSHEGIMVLDPGAVPGTPLKELLHVEEDYILEIGLTPNRADAASHYGVARDLAAVKAMHPDHRNAGKVRAALPQPEGFTTISAAGNISVKIEDRNACIRYSGITVTGVTVGESPEWLKHRLRSIGVGPINNIVDITNYVLHECGQPLHAFDADRIDGHKVIVRSAREGEKFTTLDGIERTLHEGNLMICNEHEPMCIAGVFGGAKSGIGTETKNVFLESACFSPSSVRKTAKQHGLRTDASFRFERGTDPNGTLYALKRAALMITRLAGGTIASAVIDEYPTEVKPQHISITYDYIAKFTGGLSDKSVIGDLAAVQGMEVVSSNNDGLVLSIPTYKVDVTRPVDVVEELLRIYGYDRIDVPSKLSASMPDTGTMDPGKLQARISAYLAANGFNEIFTNSLTSSAINELAGYTGNVILLNPLSSELNSMRQTMLTGALQSVQYNRNRRMPDLKFFEFGKTYSLHNGYTEVNRLAIIVAGNRHPESWSEKSAPAGFYFLKAVVENIFAVCGFEKSKLAKQAFSSPEIASGLSVTFAGKTLGVFGMVRPELASHFDIGQDVLYASFDFDTLFRLSPKGDVKVKEIPKFPFVRRDLSMIVDAGITFEAIEKSSYNAERKLLKDVNVFDVYQGDKIGGGKKSYAISFILQDESQTLTDKQIDKTMERLMTAFETELGAEIRKAISN